MHYRATPDRDPKRVAKLRREARRPTAAGRRRSRRPASSCWRRSPAFPRPNAAETARERLRSCPIPRRLTLDRDAAASPPCPARPDRASTSSHACSTATSRTASWPTRASRCATASSALCLATRRRVGRKESHTLDRRGVRPRPRRRPRGALPRTHRRPPIRRSGRFERYVPFFLRIPRRRRRLRLAGRQDAALPVGGPRAVRVIRAVKARFGAGLPAHSPRPRPARERPHPGSRPVLWVPSQNGLVADWPHRQR